MANSTISLCNLYRDTRYQPVNFINELSAIITSNGIQSDRSSCSFDMVQFDYTGNDVSDILDFNSKFLVYSAILYIKSL